MDDTIMTWWIIVLVLVFCIPFTAFGIMMIKISYQGKTMEDGVFLKWCGVALFCIGFDVGALTWMLVR